VPKSLALVPGLLTAATAVSAFAAGLDPRQSPSAFCDLASDLDYVTRPFNQKTGSCATEMRDVTPTPGKNGLQNNLAYYVMGKLDAPTQLERISLILNVNHDGESAKAHAELERVAVPVAKRLLGEEPKGFAAAVKAGKAQSWQSGPWRVQVVPSPKAAKQGRDVSVEFTPAGR